MLGWAPSQEGLLDYFEGILTENIDPSRRPCFFVLVHLLPRRHLPPSPEGRTMPALLLPAYGHRSPYRPCHPPPPRNGASKLNYKAGAISAPLPELSIADGHGSRRSLQADPFMPETSSRAAEIPGSQAAGLELESAHEEISRISRLRLRQMIDSHNLDDAKRLYARMRSRDVEFGAVLETVLINAFLKSGRLSDAFWVFAQMPERNVVAWTSVMSGCVQNGDPGLGFPLFVEMVKSGVLPNDFSFSAALQACAEMEAPVHGRQIHTLISKSGWAVDVRIGNCLIAFYSKCGLMEEAVLIFAGMPEKDVVTFTSLIAGFCKNDMLQSAQETFVGMVSCGVEANEHSIAAVLTACSSSLGKQIHGYMVKAGGSENHIYSSCSLIDFYSKNGCFEQAQLLFSKLEARNVVAWSSIISCCIRNGHPIDAILMFQEMVCSGIKPNEFTFATVIAACGACSRLLRVGLQLHCLTIKLNISRDDRIGNALITMYARNGEINESQVLFEKSKRRGVVTWSAAISGYFQNGHGEKAARLLCLMHREGHNPNEFSFSSAISSCADLALLAQGRQFHSFALKVGCDLNVCVGNALINMYAKCGCMQDAGMMFDVMAVRDLTSWNSLIHGYAQFGCSVDALQVFEEMLETQDIVPDDSTFLAVLVACSHTGQVGTALEYLKNMKELYRVTPSLPHYACVVDMMGRAGRLLEAVQIINKMPMEPDSSVWRTLLGSCRLHKNLELGKIAARKVIELSPEDSASYVLLSNLYAMHREWGNAKGVRKVMEERGVKKDAAWSWIEISSVVHAFASTDRAHPETSILYQRLDELKRLMKDEGYSLDVVSAAFEL